ncbi:hypothetical protein ACA910_008711 [Epithemia clementina (nom. ined.)]
MSTRSFSPAHDLNHNTTTEEEAAVVSMLSNNNNNNNNNNHNDQPMMTTIIFPQVLKPQESGSLTTAATETASLADETVSLDTNLSETVVSSTATTTAFSSSCSGKVQGWNGKSLFSDLVQQGLRYQQQQQQQQRRKEEEEDHQDIIMLFESPTAFSQQQHQQDSLEFYNSQVYKFHDYPRSPQPSKAVLGPCRYSLMNGATYPSYLQDEPPKGLVEHWKETIPGFVEPTFVSSIPESAQVYAYLPMEHIRHHVNDPHVHYHLAGKDAIRLMTQKTTRLYSNTKDHRPCICKTTHSMGSKGIFVIRNDEDEAEFNAFIAETGNPTFIITELVEHISRNIACHFFIHPNGDVTWFGSNENFLQTNDRTGESEWSSDSYIYQHDQDALRELQWPFVQDVVHYCRSLGFWGSCGVDVLVDQTTGQGYLVDVNPRVTGSCPAIMVSHLLRERYGFEYGLFRRSTHHAFPGPAEELLRQVRALNEERRGQCLVVIYSFYPVDETQTLVNLGVHSGTSMQECETILNMLAPPSIVE